MYWDANNLYGWAMIQDLHYSAFKFLSEQEIKRFDLDSISENSECKAFPEIGHILEVDLEY